MISETLTLRRVAPQDRTAWQDLWRAYLAFYETTLTDDAIDAAFAQLLSDAPATFQGLIAWEDDTPLGLVHWVHHPHMWRPEGVCYLQDLFTAPAARGKGVATRLIEAVYADADARGAPRVYWMTNEGNTRARALYDRIAQLTPFIKYERAS